ncbi:hypothetical protein Tco_0727271 [Tanacetum coccineum]|uniref:Transmembrane protein n=1 Tax=Tanacetum coccineum TaxID=301880 RepID=A0ABQ4YIU8_9ASTR
MRKKTLDKTHKYGLGTCVALLWIYVHFNRMIDEKFGTLDVRLRGLEKREERKECLQEFKMEGEDAKRRGKLDRVDKKVRKKVNSGYVVENVLMGCGGAIVRNIGNKKKVYAWRRFEDDKNEDDDV